MRATTGLFIVVAVSALAGSAAILMRPIEDAYTVSGKNLNLQILRDDFLLKSISFRPRDAEKYLRAHCSKIRRPSHHSRIFSRNRITIEGMRCKSVKHFKVAFYFRNDAVQSVSWWYDRKLEKRVRAIFASRYGTSSNRSFDNTATDGLRGHKTTHANGRITVLGTGGGKRSRDPDRPSGVSQFSETIVVVRGRMPGDDRESRQGITGFLDFSLGLHAKEVKRLLRTHCKSVSFGKSGHLDIWRAASCYSGRLKELALNMGSGGFRLVSARALIPEIDRARYAPSPTLKQLQSAARFTFGAAAKPNDGDENTAERWYGNLRMVVIRHAKAITEVVLYPRNLVGRVKSNFRHLQSDDVRRRSILKPMCWEKEYCIRQLSKAIADG